jgi:hypothetical protein
MILALAAVLVLGIQGAAISVTLQPPSVPEIHITVLSGRSDLVTDGQALVQIQISEPARLRQLTVRQGGRDITSRFVRRTATSTWGLVRGLPVGSTVVTAALPSGRAARLTLVNHRATGPLISGDQIEPWICDTTGADDAAGSIQPNFLGPSHGPACETPTVTKLFYKPLVGNQFRPYDPPTTPREAIASTTTQTGVTMPFIVRVEEGVQNRGIYAIATLFDPARRWTPFSQQPQWNGKVLAQFGGGNAPSHVQGLPQSVMDEHALSQGWIVAGSGLTVLGHQDNPVVAAESLMMLKERIVERYGPIRYAIGSGCSGGGILQDYAAGQYPGLLDGLLVACNYTDIWTTAPEVIDCYLLTKYLERSPERTAAVAALVGHQDLSTCEAWNLTFAPLLDPTRAQNCDLPSEQVYDPESNPRGVRCTMQDYAKSVWGQRPRSEWGPVEQSIGRGFAPFVQSNVGVLYGLKALRRGDISPADFVAVNAGVGGLTADREIVPRRTGVDPDTLEMAYRTGQVTDARQLARVPIIDLRAGANTAEIHTPVHSKILRARLDSQAGSHANHVIWTYAASAPIVGVTPPRQVADAALDTMDTWVARIDVAGGFGSAQRVVTAKPKALADSCFVGAPSSIFPAPSVPSDTQVAITDPQRCAQLYPVYSTPRHEAGAQLANTAVACTLKPLRRGDFPVPFTESQWETIKATFPTGVCDYTQPGIRERPSIPWQTYTAGPGGRALGPAPRSVQFCLPRTPCARG